MANHFGYDIVRTPRPLLRRPDHQLRLTYEAVLAQEICRTPNRCFLEVGAHDGVSNDVLLNYVRKYNWGGIVVEPQLAVFEALSTTYRDYPSVQLFNVAISNQDGRKLFYEVDWKQPGVPHWTSQLASFRRDVIVRHAQYFPDIEKYIVQRPVECYTVSTLLSMSGIPQIDIIQLDTEGYDAVILKSIDLVSILPAVIRFESRHLTRQEHDQVIELLLGHDYGIFVDGPRHRSLAANRGCELPRIEAQPQSRHLETVCRPRFPHNLHSPDRSLRATRPYEPYRPSLMAGLPTQ